jgi:hypothetical protein
MRILIQAAACSFLFFFAVQATAQDKIKLRNKDVIQAKVERAGLTWIYFSAEGIALDSIARTEVASIHYGHGGITTYHHPNEPLTGGIGRNGAGWFQWYRYPLGAQAIGYGTILCSPLLTLLPAVVVSKHGPDTRHYNIKDSSRIQDAAYMNEVKTQAKREKKKATWNLYGQGTVIFLISWGIMALLLSGYQQ